jgi:hypothetical protein
MYPGLPTRLEKDIRERYLNEVLKGTRLLVLYCVLWKWVCASGCGPADTSVSNQPSCVITMRQEETLFTI